MLEEIWFVMVIWLIVLIIGIRYKNVFFSGLGSVIGILFGMVVLSDVYVWLGLILIVSSIYTLWLTLYRHMGGKK